MKKLVKIAIARTLGQEGLDRIRQWWFVAGVGRKVRRGGEPELRAVDRFVGEGDVCLDIGANYGLYTYRLSRLVGPMGRIHAFEPLPIPFRILRSIQKRHSLGNVSPHQVALSDKAGTLSMVIPRTDGGIFDYGRAFIGGPKEDAPPTDSETVEVRVSSLDRFAAETGLDRLSFVKCDVEGAESMVFRGGEQTIRKEMPVILSEIEERHTRKYGYAPNQVFEYLFDLGYLSYVYRDDRLQQVSGPEEGFRNFFFVPRAWEGPERPRSS